MGEQTLEMTFHFPAILEQTDQPMRKQKQANAVFQEQTSRSLAPSSSFDTAIPPPGARTNGPRWGRAAINLFLLWHLYALTIWLLPQSALRESCVQTVTPYMTFTGLMQSWTMFSPDPSKLDMYVEARITYANGQERSWTYPRMINLGYIERYRHERFRKFIELAHLEDNRMIWPSVARYAARVNNHYPHNPPVDVQLIRHFRFTPPPGGEWAPYQTSPFYKQAILEQDLQ